MTLPQAPSIGSEVEVSFRPSSAVVPANLLRMYVSFNQPMVRQVAGFRLRLGDGDGRDWAGMLLDLGQELWSPDSTRLTVLLHPGLTKRGLSRSGEGLTPGQRLSLTVEAGWPAQNGGVLKQSSTHDYQVVQAERTAIDPQHWSVSTPQPGTKDDLVVTFDRIMDAGLLEHRLLVVPGDRPIRGQGTVDPGERSWRFRPTSNWSKDGVQVVALPGLEDCCGNGLDAPFEHITERARPALRKA